MPNNCLLIIFRHKHLKILFVLWTLLSVVSLHATESRLSKIQERGAVRVCVWPDYYSISYRNPKTQELIGIDVDMAYQLANDLGVKVQFVESSFSRLIDDVTNEYCDIAMFGIGIIPSRKKHLRFTSAHLQSDIYAITTRSNRVIKQWRDIDQAGVLVAVAKGTLHELMMQQKLQHAELVILDSPHAREQEVESGRADVFMTDYPYSQKILATTDWARLIKPDRVYHMTPYAYAIKPGDDIWFERVEAFVQQVKQDGRLRTAAQKHKLTPILISD